MIDILDYQGKRVHMIGIGGSSMSGLAEMLLKEGYTVTGSDNANSHAVERLRNMGVDVKVGAWASPKWSVPRCWGSSCAAIKTPCASAAPTEKPPRLP